MKVPPKWLPALVTLGDYGGDWNAYVDALYQYFSADFVRSRPIYDSRPVGAIRSPISDGKVSGFWHLVSEGKDEASRLPNLRRCERIRWPRPIIEHCQSEEVKCWTNKRGGDRRVVLWLEEFDYVVILADRREYLLLWTAYYIDYNHTRKKLYKEYEASK